MTELTDDVVRQWLDRAKQAHPINVYHGLEAQIIALSEALLKERAAKRVHVGDVTITSDGRIL